MKTNLLITGLITLLLGIVLNELGFFDSGKLIRGLRNLGILTSDMVPPDFPFFPWRGGPSGKPCLCPSPALCSAFSHLSR